MAVSDRSRPHGGRRRRPGLGAAPDRGRAGGRRRSADPVAGVALPRVQGRPNDVETQLRAPHARLQGGPWSRQYAAATMKSLDRFTRDRHSRFIWGGATVVFLASALAALWWGGEVLADEEQGAQDLAVEYTTTVLFEALDADLLGDEIRGRQYRDLIIQVQGGIMTDEGVARVRIWAPDGTLLFSTESLEQIGVAKALNSEPIEAAVDGRVSSVVSEATVEAKSGLTGSTQRLFQTFAPIRVRERTAILGVAEVDRTYTSIARAAEQPWRALQIGLGAAALLCALLFLL